MPVTYFISSQILWLQIDGYNSPEEVSLTIVSAFDDPMFVKGMPLLIDLRKAEISFTVEKIRERASYYASLKEFIAPRCAIVAAKTLLIVMSKVFQVFAESQGLRVYITENVHEALRWLVLDGRIELEADLPGYRESEPEVENAGQKLEAGLNQFSVLLEGSLLPD